MPDLPVGIWVERFVEFLLAHFSPLFDLVAAVLLFLVRVVYWVLIQPHPLLMAAVLTRVAWVAIRRWRGVRAGRGGDPVARPRERPA